MVVSNNDETQHWAATKVRCKSHFEIRKSNDIPYIAVIILQLLQMCTSQHIQVYFELLSFFVYF